MMGNCHIFVTHFNVLKIFIRKSIFSLFLTHFCGMLKKLQQHWGVNGLQVILILLTFALGGSLCGYLGRKLLGYVTIDSKALWILVYVVLVTILWPFCVLLISIPFGQFSFFRKYVGKLLKKLKGKSEK
jgi:hypothetical protein